MAKVTEHPKFKNIYYLETETGKQLGTMNLSPGHKVYGEELFRVANVEYRAWNPYRSKLAAAIERGINAVPLNSGSKVLYLGAASGTTPSHVSDIVGPKGRVYCVEFAPRVIRELLEVTSKRKNMIPILGDARKPQSYRFFLEMVDAVYCDVAQPEQARLLIENAGYYLKKGGRVMIAIKARSVDVTMDPAQVFKQEVKVLEEASFKTIDMKLLEPYEKDHAMVVAEGN